jgi:hypothetical protein
MPMPCGSTTMLSESPVVMFMRSRGSSSESATHELMTVADPAIGGTLGPPITVTIY